MISLTKRLWLLAGPRGMSWSYVLRVWHAGRSILIPGDIEERG
jgi:hypothetical protein